MSPAVGAKAAARRTAPSRSIKRPAVLSLDCALAFAVAGEGPAPPAAGTDIYDVPGGTKGGLALWNYDFSINPGNLTNFTASLTITGDGQSSSLNPLGIGDNTTNTAGAKQNSENMAFGLFSGFTFNPNPDVTYKFDLTLMNAAGQVVATDEIQVAVPEPSTWAMMMIGFLGVGLMVY